MLRLVKARLLYSECNKIVDKTGKTAFLSMRHAQTRNNNQDTRIF
ncbi:hypothetical protein BSS2_II0804 [Brucella suis bv. 1 str. S2]|uniref:Uncharacterized protein n=7 Tax=Brucella TaxID=234 RepID=Q2YIX4_BRUA2|nr:hypothetical protein BRA0848 [Brucella suis 1330]AAX75812.1 hypothetical protein BruAb2_0383 [Brucella abortus bv. 1 str. 9-941]ABX64019.1 Hypothetical protein, conserved [Brucella canis ATCC 23365]ABY39800.1 Hypothetical protein, conserved [Brucella suis ATCC 23445]ACO02628.1 Hypothetical protein, conserved [Brucella melitensis ATCC 23457]ACU49958.1 hypothetical protein BMI_II842 [Brucella microti CCM 4915]AEK56321.1 hypothetical protein BPI_II904 [Brucella pinnipedialis B2/94]AEU07970.1